MTKIILPVLLKARNFLQESLSVALPLLRIMIPMIIVVKILKEMGAIEILGQWLAPLMGIVGLPGSMGLVWAATMVAGFFPGIIIFADLATNEILTVGQVTVLSSMMLIAHSLPVELQIADKAGARWLSMGVFRVGGALLYGLILNQILLWGNWLTESSILLWHPETGPVDLQTWAWDQIVSLILMFVILLCIMFFMKVLDKFGFSIFLQSIFKPLLSKLGIGKEAVNITVIGITLGIAFGGGLIIKESHVGKIPARDIFFALVLMGLFHSFVEDTLLMMLLGGSLWGFLVGRLIFALLAVWLLVRLLSLMPEKQFQRYFFKPKAIFKLNQQTKSTLKDIINLLITKLMEDIPLIDLQPQFENHAKETEIVKQIRDACENNGFFAVRGHGIPEIVIEHCWQVSHDFFALAEEEKQKVKMPFAGYPYGFAGMEAETLSRSRGQKGPPDLKENFSVGPNATPPEGISEDEVLFVYSENQWPQNPVNFKQAWETCYEAMSLLSMRLMKLFALALKLPQNYFDEFLKQPISALRANHYPALKKTVLPGQLRAGEHSDYGSLTLLLQDEGFSGLEILNRQKEWIPVIPCKPDVIVNLGDLMEHWTNGRWISTLHRVIVPDTKKSLTKSRMSLAFFQQPDWNARIECLPTCVDPRETAKVSAITSGRYLMDRFHSTVLNEI